MVKEKYFISFGDAMHITKDKDNILFQNTAIEVEMVKDDAIIFVEVMLNYGKNGICNCDDSIIKD